MPNVTSPRRSVSLDAHHRLAIAALLAAVPLIALGNRVGPASQIIVAWDVFAVVGAWLVVHTAFALRYAHLYYAKPDAAAGQTFRKGLEFPGTAKPDYMDFAYFSFVIGMTSQVSDVQITSPSLRRHALVHGVLSFFFNVVILGLTISVMSGLL